jgi:hypothetical protein
VKGELEAAVVFNAEQDKKKIGQQIKTAKKCEGRFQLCLLDRVSRQ